MKMAAACVVSNVGKKEGFTRVECLQVVRAGVENKMVNCDSCFFKLQKKSRYSCGHVLCQNCIFVDEINKADFEKDEKKVEIVTEEIQELKKETALVKFTADKLLLHKEINDILKFDKEDLKLFMESFVVNINDRLKTIDASLYKLTTKLDELAEKQETHLKRYENDCKSSKALTKSKSSDGPLNTYISQHRFNFAYRWKLENFNQLQRRAWRFYDDEILFSQPFSCDLGYRMSLLLCPYGIGVARGKYLSLYFKIIDGPNDKSLKWPVRFKVQFTMIDLLNNKYHYYYLLPRAKSVIYSPTREDDTFCRGEKRFIHLNELKPHYLVDNTICVQVDVAFL